METVKDIPQNYQRIMPYLVIKDAAAFFEFMQKVFGATEQYKQMRDENTIMHAELNIKGSTIMYCDSTETYHVQNSGMFIYIDSCDETYKKAIDSGAETIIEPADQPYGRSAGVKDAFGNTWWINQAI